LAAPGCQVHAGRRGHRLDRDALTVGNGASGRRAAGARETLRLDGIRVHVAMAADEAEMQDTPYGSNPVAEGWFVLNLGEALAVRNDVKGAAVYPLEPEGGPFTGFGVNVHVVWPGEPSAMYHSEGVREAFLVLSGECTLIVEEQERPLRQWDFFHCPAGTSHVFVGAGDGPCAILMIGARPD